MNNIDKLVHEIKRFCEENSNPQVVEKYSKYFREGYDAFGLSEGVVTNQKKFWLSKYADLGLTGFFDLGDKLIKTGRYEEASFAIVFVESFAKQFNKETLSRIKNWYDDGVCNWAHSDFICGTIIRSLVKGNIIENFDFDKWRESKSRWTRRAVPVSLLEFIRKGDNILPLLEFVRPMMMDNERVVHQGLGWFLRECWKKNPEPVEKLLYDFKDKSARLIFQYATEKMTKEQKERFRASKKKK